MRQLTGVEGGGMCPGLEAWVKVGLLRAGAGSRFFVCLFLPFVLLGPRHGTWRFPVLGSNQSCSCRPQPQPQQHQIQAASATYTRAHGNAGSVIH